MSDDIFAITGSVDPTAQIVRFMDAMTGRPFAHVPIPGNLSGLYTNTVVMGTFDHFIDTQPDYVIPDVAVTSNFEQAVAAFGYERAQRGNTEQPWHILMGWCDNDFGRTSHLILSRNHSTRDIHQLARAALPFVLCSAK